ncbi:MAG: hypothetical protein WA708_13285 [Acidobacteriaceae bacterium]
MCQLIVTDHRIPADLFFALPPKTGEECVGHNRAKQNLASCREALASLGVDHHSRIHNLNDVIRPDREAVVRWIAAFHCALRTGKVKAETVEAIENC